MLNQAQSATEVSTIGRAAFQNAFVTASAAAVLGVSLGYASLSGLSGFVDDAHGILSTSQILRFNLPVLMLFYSGIATAGCSTVAALVLTGGYIGATFAAAAANVGITVALGSIALYAPLEFGGLMLAATAGLLPVSAMRARRPGVARFAAYQSALVPSAGMVAVALILLVLGAVVEAAVLVGRQ